MAKRPGRNVNEEVVLSSSPTELEAAFKSLVFQSSLPEVVVTMGKENPPLPPWVDDEEFRIDLEELRQAFPSETSVLLSFLSQKGVPEKDVEAYLNAPLEAFGSKRHWMRPLLDAAVNMVQRHAKIGVYGDYDTDGLLATKITLDALETVGKETMSVIPTKDEGYGVHEHILRRMRDEGVTLVMTVDCGASDIPSLARLFPDLEFLVLDHHPVYFEPEDIPPNVLLVDPNAGWITPTGEPDTALCGAGVATFFVLRLLRREGFDVKEAAEEILPLMGMATLADNMDCGDLDNHIAMRQIQGGMARKLKRGDPSARFIYELIKQAKSGEEPCFTPHEIVYFLNPFLSFAKRTEQKFYPEADPNRILAALRDGDVEFVPKLISSYRSLKEIYLHPFLDRVRRGAEERGGGIPLLFAAEEDIPSGISSWVAETLRNEGVCDIAVIVVKDSDTGTYKGSLRSSIPLREAVSRAMEECGGEGLEMGGHDQAMGISRATQEGLRALKKNIQKALAQRGVEVDCRSLSRKGRGRKTQEKGYEESSGFRGPWTTASFSPHQVSVPVLFSLFSRLAPWGGASKNKWYAPTFLLKKGKVEDISQEDDPWGPSLSFSWGDDKILLKKSKKLDERRLVGAMQGGGEMDVWIRVYGRNDLYLEDILPSLQDEDWDLFSEF